MLNFYFIKYIKYSERVEKIFDCAHSRIIQQAAFWQKFLKKTVIQQNKYIVNYIQGVWSQTSSSPQWVYVQLCSMQVYTVHIKGGP